MFYQNQQKYKNKPRRIYLAVDQDCTRVELCHHEIQVLCSAPRYLSEPYSMFNIRA